MTQPHMGASGSSRINDRRRTDDPPLVSEDRVTIGKIERPFGVRGEVRVRSLSDVPGRFEGLDAVTLVAADGQKLEARVLRSRPIPDGYLVQLDGCSSPEDAARFRGALLQIARDQAAADTAAGRYYEFQLVGLRVEDETGEVFGRLEDIVETRGGHVLIVRGARGEHLLPATKEVVTSVDLEARIMTVRWTARNAGSADAV